MRKTIILAVLAAFVGAASLVAQSGLDQALETAGLLSGTFHGNTPGNELRLDLRPIQTDPEHPSDLFLEVTGKYQGDNVRRQGVLRFATQGKSVYVGYVPHFDPTITSLSADATRFSDTEAGAACGFTLARRGDGYAGETSGASCAFALRSNIQKWSIEIEPGTIRLRDVKTGETLRFRRDGT
ncbi:MAG TPA: hypothetical protein VF376_01290 [Thermoanaerobaculia bacterium]